MDEYKYKKSFRLNFKVMLVLLLLVFIIICIFKQIDKRFLPSAISISHIDAKKSANKVINTAVNNSIKDFNIKAADFIEQTDFQNINSISANTILINEICADVSTKIDEGIKKISDEKIEIPFGATTGIDMLANTGPNFHFKMLPMGSSEIDYDTSFTSAGINQTNFKIWLNISINVELVNPLIKDNIVITRKVMLVDTIINGVVPESYLNFGNK